MKSYPSIPSVPRIDIPVIAFDKIDGSNIRVEWSKKQKGFFAFGTRTRLIDKSDPIFGQVETLVNEKYCESITKVLRDNKHESATCFFEFHGPNSAFGQHQITDVKTVTLIDVAPLRMGILEPHLFLKYFDHIDHAKVLYAGDVTPEFVKSVLNATLKNMTFEGVVCKAPNDKKTKAPIMFKIKSQQWIEKLKQYCLEKNQSFDELL